MALSFLGRSDLPRGIRNNNPGNLVKTNIKWQGKITPGADSRFEQFKSLYYGLRAMYLDLLGDYYNKGLTTVRQLITEFAPPHENLTSNYISRVADYLQVTPDQMLTRPNLRDLGPIISIVENGEYADDYIPRSEFDHAWKAALKNYPARPGGNSLPALLAVAALLS